jgi:hypothetical protein
LGTKIAGLVEYEGETQEAGVLLVEFWLFSFHTMEDVVEALK